jgi:hypothetical protein
VIERGRDRVPRGAARQRGEPAAGVVVQACRWCRNRRRCRGERGSVQEKRRRCGRRSQVKSRTVAIDGVVESRSLSWLQSSQARRVESDSLCNGPGRDRPNPATLFGRRVGCSITAAERGRSLTTWAVASGKDVDAGLRPASCARSLQELARRHMPPPPRLDSHWRIGIVRPVRRGHAGSGTARGRSSLHPTIHSTSPELSELVLMSRRS